ncbi:hypothetical protein B0H21DRAFT_705733 [Amylocystis lapponica]|nr:hypothetical protein B0H21DRAFT_705733 [Amylocystis lapponica]
MTGPPSLCFDFDFSASAPSNTDSELSILLPDAELQVSIASESSGLPQSPSESSSSQSTEALGTFHPATKWPATEDLTQYAVMAAHHIHLKKAGAQELDKVAKLLSQQRSIWMSVQLLKLNKHMDVIQPTDSQWDLPKTLKDKVDQYALAVLLSHLLPSYLGKVTNPLSAIKIVQHPTWGYMKEVRTDKYKCDLVMKRIATCLTDRHADIRELITLSLGPEILTAAHRDGNSKQTLPKVPKKRPVNPVGLNIVQLCEAIAAKCALGSHFCLLKCKLLLEMLKQLRLEPAGGYWVFVDTQLAVVRELFFTQILKEDLEKYGYAHILGEGVSTDSNVSRTQNITDSAACGLFIDNNNNY